ncbi:MAG: hypothetical protein H8E34_12795 [Bacteroidetes bacterium]|nr:hypothetical protein [Bacteroidota bacterium]
MPKQANTRPVTSTKEKVLMRVSAFFNASMCHIITMISDICIMKLKKKLKSKSLACFKLKIEHEKMIRINKKTPLWKSTPHQQLRRVASKRSVWWYRS